MVQPSSPMAQHEARSHTTQPNKQSMASALLHHASKFTQTNGIHAAFSVVSMAANQSLSLNRGPHRISLFAPFPCPDCQSCLNPPPSPLSLRPIHHPPQRRGLASCHSWRRVFACSEMSNSVVVVLRTRFVSNRRSCKCKNVGKSHGGN